tara:strand:+ start:309 stop:521 length:213 start_codon:yes stop_codon:yes gene_type:complete
MYKIILILVFIITIYLFISIYKKIIESDNNKIIENLKEYAEKEKIKQFKSEIQKQSIATRKTNKKKKANV